MSPKKALVIIATALGITAGVVVLVPQAGPVLGPLLSGAGRGLERVADGMLDDCPPRVCAFDPKDGQNHVHGPIAFLDGGSCVCR